MKTFTLIQSGCYNCDWWLTHKLVNDKIKIQCSHTGKWHNKTFDCKKWRMK